jgi:hypothetical protein
MTLHIGERVEVRHKMRIMVHSVATAQRIVATATRAGDIPLDWNPADPASVGLAREAYGKAIALGFKAYRMDARGKQGSPMSSFDPAAENLLLIPPIVGG